MNVANVKVYCECCDSLISFDVGQIYVEKFDYLPLFCPICGYPLGIATHFIHFLGLEIRVKTGENLGEKTEATEEQFRRFKDEQK
jgi:hypothetical protein